MNNFDLKKFLVENKLTSNSRAINEAMSDLVYQIPNDAPDLALKPYIGKFLSPGNSVKMGTGDTMVSTANEYEKVGGLFKYLPNSIELTPPAALSSFGKSLGKPEVAKNDNEKPAEYRDESGKKIKNKDFDINKVSYKIVNETEYENTLQEAKPGTVDTLTKWFNQNNFKVDSQYIDGYSDKAANASKSVDLAKEEKVFIVDQEGWAKTQDGKEYIQVFIPWNDELKDKIKKEFNVVDIGGSNGTYYALGIEKQ